MIRVKPPVIGYSLIALALILHFLFPGIILVSFPYNLLGIVGVLAGFKIALWGKKTFQRLDTPLRPGDKPKQLVVEGPFKFTRNPMYLGFFLFILGVAVILGSLAALIAPVAFLIIIHFFFIPFEEKLMKKTFGNDYADYQRRTRKWI